MGVFTGISVLIAIELILRLRNYSRNIISYNIKNYPFYRRPRNKKGKDLYSVERLGKRKAPIIRTYYEGIRGKFNHNKTNILIAGCSFTEGAGHIDKKTYPGYLQNMIPSLNIVNAGIGGYGPFQIAKLVEQSMKYQPNAVVVQLLDFRRVPLNSQRILMAKKELNFYLNIKKISLILSYMLKFKQKKYQSLRAPYLFRNTTKEKLWEVNQQYLDKIHKTCQSNGSKLLMFVWPSNESEWLSNSYLQKKVEQYCFEREINYFNACNLYKHYSQKELTLENDGHPSSLANKLIAQATYNCLAQNKIIN